jgi:hypothetical protein
MTVRSAAPPSAPLVYSLLVVLGVLAALISAATLAYISYRYVTDEELRNPVPIEGEAEPHAQLPEWLSVS